ncbi:MAG TPA: WecB/TagA/CpsF family glycosyltransferase [Capsulimonadaceae bacterium]|nr:WecB/TagA/CpsF family glycosyltransferase [Capsulimonadaceae bacterium]
MVRSLVNKHENIAATYDIMPVMDSVSLLGMKVHRLSMGEALENLEQYIAEGKPRHIVTADASMVVQARRDPDLAAIVENADLVTPDGAGLLWASQLLRKQLVHRVSGVDLVAELSRLSARKGYRLFLLGAGPGVAEAAAQNLRERFPGAQFVGTRNGFFTAADEPEIVRQIVAAKPDVLLVAFGIPKQEKFINRHRAVLGVPVLIGVGGSFDVYSGRVKRAPKWMQNAGFEWLFRLCQNPRKIGKVMALPQFALLTIRARLTGTG